MTLQEKIQACKDQAAALIASNIPFFHRVEFDMVDVSWEEFSQVEEKNGSRRFRCGDGIAIIMYGGSFQINIHTVPLRIKETFEVLETA